jgi:hypothetical protein
MAFRLGSGGGFTGVLESVSYNPSYLVIGDIAEGVFIHYFECLLGDVLVATVTYTVLGTSAACSYVEILPAADNDVIETYDCDMNVEPVTGYPLIVNFQPGCGHLWCVLGVQESTWGSIKALYR